VAKIKPSPEPLSSHLAEQVEIEAKYAGYIEKQKVEVARFRRLEERRIPLALDYDTMVGLRVEAKERLSYVQPTTVGQASRLSGVNPADISVLLVHLKRMDGEAREGRESIV
jgi:tRNA uridine 5-carboxymethylaminomethyl modification enzyme